MGYINGYFQNILRQKAVYLGPWQNQFARTFLEHANEFSQFSLQSRHLQNDLFEKWKHVNKSSDVEEPHVMIPKWSISVHARCKNCYVKNLLGKCYILLDFWKQSWTGISSNTNNGKFACGHQLRLFCYADALEPLTLGKRSSRWWKGSLTGSDGYEHILGALNPHGKTCTGASCLWHFLCDGLNCWTARDVRSLAKCHQLWHPSLFGYKFQQEKSNLQLVEQNVGHHQQ